MVVTAPCAESLEIAENLANRLGIIVGRRKWVHQMHATVRDNGMADRLSGFCPVELGVTDFQTDHEATERRLTAAGRKAIEEDCARRSSSAAPWKPASTTASRRRSPSP